jgi:2,3-bisphosphoglycerate-dependent phosphoglycerate mutase
VVDVVLVRHGQSGNNLLWERTGSSRGRSPDPELTPLGEQQAKAVAAAFDRNEFGVRPTQIWTSLMTRAVQTAAPLADALDLPLTGHAEIFEYYGPVVMDPDDPERMWPHPGASRADLHRRSERLVLPEVVTDTGWWSGPVEDEAACATRAARVVAQLRAADPDAVIVLVTHATFTQYLIRNLLGVREMTGWLRIDNTAVSRFRGTEDLTVADWINRTSHLTPGQLSA